MRLIDADKLKKDLKSVTLSNGTLLNTNTVLLLLDKYPTAYDVDKVVEELEGAMWLTTNDDGETNKLSIQVVSFDDAIEIVKAGGNS